MYRDGVQIVDEIFEDFLIPLSLSQAKDIDSDLVHSVLCINSNVQFFSCKFLTDDNLCSNQNKPEICSKFPSSPFACVSENCGYAGELFLSKETVKQKIRRLKEEIIDYETQIAVTRDKREKEHLKKIIVYHQKFIGKYKDYGSKNW